MRIDWRNVSCSHEAVGGMLCGSVCTLMVIAALAACATGKARQATVDHNKVEVPVTVEANADIDARLSAAMVQIDELRAALVGPVSVGPIGGNHAGGDLQTVDSLTAQILARAVSSTLKWSVLISLATVAAYVLCHRFRSTRKVLDFCKGHAAVAARHEGTEALRHETHGTHTVGITHDERGLAGP